MDPVERSRRIQTIGLAMTILLGLSFHELYKTTGITLLGVISPVNESKWEHWKMAYSPMLIVGGFEYLLLKKQTRAKPGNYVFALAGGIIVFELTTFGLIELYEVIFGHSELMVHVSTFLLGGVLGHRSKYSIMEKSKPSLKFEILGSLILVFQLMAFAAFTFDPPRIEYFRDSLTQTYGIDKLR